MSDLVYFHKSKLDALADKINEKCGGDRAFALAESVRSIIDGLATVTSKRTLTLHTDVKSKLTDEQKSAIASKNWKLA